MRGNWEECDSKGEKISDRSSGYEKRGDLTEIRIELEMLKNSIRIIMMEIEEIKEEMRKIKVYCHEEKG